ncbi:MAG: histidine phosphatase family protein [Gemmatimonadetes bacterium]|nr:histidine phosphatase family protein [Gemmatimonadota bacterium]
MKTLLVLRHAKSSWDDHRLKDHDRPLNPRGARDAPRMGQHLVDEDLVPTRILTSSAVRALSTAELAASELGEEVEIEVTRDLYLASPHTYVDVIEELAGDHDRVMVVGHNPGISALVTVLSGACEEMPTAALAAVELDIDDWSELGRAGEGSLLGFWRPKALGSRSGDG